jgi:3-deoxy-D-manno-octulosonic-acid transferase
LAQTFLPKGSYAYLPFDDPWILHYFIKRLQPNALIIMETELWPNLLWVCQQKKIPVFLANARLSKKSARRYAYFRILTRMLLPPVTIFAQSRKDAKRFQFLGATHIKVCGNLKFDIKPPPEAYEKARHFRSLIQNRFVICIASTRSGEEETILKNLALLFESIPELLLLIVPRHPERFAEVEALLKKENYTYQKRSDEHPVASSTKIWLGDSMGELYAYYGAADIAVVGGSFLDYGGQNPIEAMAMGIPVIMGPHTEHFSNLVRQAMQKKALLQLKSPSDLSLTMFSLYQDADKRQQLRTNAFAFWEKEQGAAQKIMQDILSVLQSKKSSR